jgi:hypothetical protein
MALDQLQKGQMRISHSQMSRAAGAKLKFRQAMKCTERQRIWLVLCTAILMHSVAASPAGRAAEKQSFSSANIQDFLADNPAVEFDHHRGSGDAVALLQGDSFWELSTAVAPPGSRGCKSGRFFISVGVHGGGSTPGTGDNAVLLRGELARTGSGLFEVRDELPAELYQHTLFPLRSPSDPDDQSFADNVMTRIPDGTILLLRDLALDTLPFPKLDDGAGLWASKDCGNTWEFRSFLSLHECIHAPSSRRGSASTPADCPPVDGYAGGNSITVAYQPSVRRTSLAHANTFTPTQRPDRGCTCGIAWL